MLYSTYLARVRYLGDNVTDTFNIPFDFKDNTDVKVVIAFSDGTEVLLTFGVHYLVIGSLPSQVWLIGWGPLLAGQVMCVARDMPMVNTLDLLANDSLPSADLQNAMDRAFMSAAQAQDLYVSALRLKATSPLSAGQYDASDNRISNVASPVLDTDAATKGWVSILLAQYSQGIASVVTPGGASTAQWNANQLQSRAVASTAPTNGQVLAWNTTSGRWEPTTIVSGSSLLASNNTWSGTNTYNATVAIGNSVSLQLSANANINFIGITSRIKGVFSGTPNSQRTLFAPSAGPNHCYIGAVPSGAGNEAGFYMFGGPDPDNAPALFLSAGPTATSIQSLKSGTGVVQPLNLISGPFVAMTVRTNGRVGFQNAPDNGAEVNLGTGKLCRNSAAFQAHRNGVAQTIPFNVFTKVLFTTEDFDQAGWFDTTLARYTPLVPGKYMMNWALTYLNGLVDQKRVASVLYKNGVYFKTGAQISESGGEFLSTVGACLVDANGTTDYFELFAWHDMAANADLAGNSNDNYFAGFHIG